MYSICFKFIICVGIIFFAGKKVALYADIIAEKMAISRLFIGVVLVAAATSLPELFTGIGSVSFTDAPNIAIGNVFGANAYNLLNIGLLDLLYKGGGSLLCSLSQGQVLTASLTLIPVILASIPIILSNNGITSISIWHVGFFSIAIFISYLVIMRIIYSFESKIKHEEEDLSKYENISLKKAFLSFTIAACLIAISGIWLAYIGKELSVVFKLNESFVGGLFLGFATTLPEITVSIAALSIGAKELAIANMLGSNLFNTTIIFIDDIFYRKASILDVASKNNTWMAFIVMAMTAIIIMAMSIKRKDKGPRINWYIPLLIAIFLFGVYTSFVMGAK